VLARSAKQPPTPNPEIHNACEKVIRKNSTARGGQVAAARKKSHFARRAFACFRIRSAHERNRLRKILRLDPDIDEFKVVFGMLPKAKDEIAFRTRSVLRILTFLALDVQVPECHLADGRAPDLGDTSSPTQPQLTVLSGCEPLCDAFTAVQYRGHWFWMDQRDTPSKRTFAYL